MPLVFTQLFKSKQRLFAVKLWPILRIFILYCFGVETIFSRNTKLGQWATFSQFDKLILETEADHDHHDEVAETGGKSDLKSFRKIASFREISNFETYFQSQRRKTGR